MNFPKRIYELNPTIFIDLSFSSKYIFNLFMRPRILLFPLILFLFNIQFSTAQETLKSEVIHCEQFHVTRPLIEINKEHPVNERKIERKLRRERKEEIVNDKKKRRPQHFQFTFEKNGFAYGTDSSIIQKSDGSRKGKAPIQNWTGLSLNGMYPPDPTGAAGTQYYLQATNSTTYRVYNKSNGSIVTTGTLGNLWSPATPNDGDPIVMYDRYADRWFISQFGDAGNKMYIAISQTNDPAGSYYTYTYSSPQFPDYLKFSIWSDGYYMTSNQSTQKVFAFEREKMLLGDPTARAVYTSFNPPNGGGFFVPLPADADGNGGLPPVGTPCPIFSFSDNAWGSGISDAIQIYNMSVNWQPTTPTATISFATSVPTAAFDASYSNLWDDIPQPGTSQKLDGIGGILNYRAQWRKWSDHNSVVLTWGVKVGTSQRSVMWCELRQDQTNSWSMYQQGVFAPDSYYRWVGSISMDDMGNIALCYAISGSSIKYPSLAYTGRMANDPLNTMTVSETIAIDGVVSQTGNVNRFGDYSQTTLDPDGTTFWHTGEYMGGNSNYEPKTRVYSFQLISPNAALVSINSSVSNNVICSGTSVTFTATPTNGGDNPSYQWQVNGNNVGTNSPTYTTNTLSNGSVVTCIMISSSTTIGNPATSNSITMTVNSPATPTITVLGPISSCEGSSVNLSVNASNTGSTPAYQWTVNGVNVGSSASYYSYIPSNNDVIQCTLFSSSSCITSTNAVSNPFTISVISVPPPSISYNGGVLTSSSTTGNQWYLNGVFITGATGQNYIPTTNGNYTVTTSFSGCTSQASAIFNVKDLGLDNLKTDFNLSVYPNPSQGVFNLSFNTIPGESYTLKLIDETGRIVMSESVSAQQITYTKEFNLSKEASGVYNLFLSDGMNDINRKIILKK